MKFMQAIDYEMLVSSRFLTDEEAEILRWGRNARVTPPKRFRNSGQHLDIYRRATAVECLVSPAAFTTCLLLL